MTDSIVSEYLDAYRRARDVAAFWVWYAMTQGHAPDEVPRDCLRPSGRIVWVVEDVSNEHLPTDDEIEEMFRSIDTP